MRVDMIVIKALLTYLFRKTNSRCRIMPGSLKSMAPHFRYIEQQGPAFCNESHEKGCRQFGSISVKISGDGILRRQQRNRLEIQTCCVQSAASMEKCMQWTRLEISEKLENMNRGDDYLHSSPSDGRKEPNQTLHPSNGSQCIESVIIVGL